MRLKFLPRFYILFGLALVAVTIGIAAASRPVEALTNCTVSDLTVDSEEGQFLSLINAYRPSSAPDLTISVNLNRAASWMARDLATRTDGVFSHTDSLGRSAGTRASQCDAIGGIGENIAAGTVRDTAQEAFDAWQASSGHNANMLNSSYRQIGIARYYDAGSTYRWYWVTVFSTSDDGTRINPSASSPTATATATRTPTPTATRTATPTATAVPPTATAVPPTSTATAVPPTATATAVPPTATVPPSETCTAPIITSDYDTSPTGGGTVNFTWAPVSGATAYRVARMEGGSWVSKGTYSGTSYTGTDGSDDPQWRVYVVSGTCTPKPGPAVPFDPDGLPACTAPVIVSDTDTDPSAGGTVTFSWNAVMGASTYRIARRDNGAWVIKATVSGTTYSGDDGADDPQWRVYVASGGCTPVPGPANPFDPT